jgi:hypothetical protein
LIAAGRRTNVGRKRKKSQYRRPTVAPSPAGPTSFETEPRPVDGFGRSRSFNPDYTYVREDLRRIGLLAGSFIVLLIVGSFFFR